MVLISIVSAKINKIQVQITNTRKNPQIEPASSNIDPSLLQFKALDIDADRLNISLLISKFIIMGNIIKAIIIIAIIPQEFFIADKLALTVRNASFTVPPMNGTKLLIANFAVFIDRLSDACVKTFLQESINIKMDITNTVMLIKEFFKIFEIPLKS